MESQESLGRESGQQSAERPLLSPAGTDSAPAKTPESTGPALPAINLPKGGGAIRGIGEKFSANPVTGTGSMSVPIATSPGRSGFGPQLSLTYDSGSENGPFGFGWTLSLPAITRKTDKGLPQYRDADESDVYLLSGAEDLVPVLGADGKRFEDSTTVPGYLIHRYRPRIEGLFARIERWTHRATGEIHWRSITRDNVTTLYGRTNNSRVFDPSDPAREHPTRIFTWLICESYDDKGNASIYEYAAEDDASVDLSQANERNRVRTANRYPKRIKYGNRTSRLIQPDLTQTEWMFEVVFDYDEGHYEQLDPDPARPEAEQHRFVHASAGSGLPWAIRPDPFSSHRSGFEVRTYRRCHRVLMFHRFPELGDEPCLVRSTELDYTDLDYSHPLTIEAELAHQGSTRFASFIRSVTQSGFVRDATQAILERNGVNYATYLTKSLPPLEFEYSKASIEEEIHELDAESLENLPIGLDGTSYQLVDLDGEGVSGILTEQADAWFYKPNLGEGHFGPLQTVTAKPSLAALTSGRQQLLDLAGDGQLDLVAFAGPTPGFYGRTPDEDWEPFQAFRSLPNLPWDDPNLRFVDLDGDGHADILITEQDVFTWYPSLAEAGFAPARHVHQSWDEERGPRLVLADGTQSIHLADMCGDGLTDLVRIRNGEVCYWPNLGYGHFGAKVTMDNAPCFDNPDQFDQRRVRLADIDGSGTTDIIYLHSDGVRLYLNQSGNRLSEARRLAQFPCVHNVSSVMTADLLGNGTACLVWSSPLPTDARRPLRYIDLMSGTKPHLLIKSVNNLGAERQVHYASSTRFYLQDKRDGKPWMTRLPFPLHVVERVETYDHLSRNRFVTRYAYHHGYFDGEEREFRGFGMVEQWDTELIAALGESDMFPVGDNVDAASHVPPVRTKTWFHTGAYLGGDHVSDFFAGLLHAGDTGEYYREPGLTDAQARALLLQDTLLPVGLTLKEEREACRALKGVMLRQEVYALDGTPQADHPYTVVEQNFAIRRLQPRGESRHAVFFTSAYETVNYHYERNPSDPRVQHTITLEVDGYGDVLKEATVGYGRRQPDPSLPLDADRDTQTRTLITYSEHRVTKPIGATLPDDHRTPLPCETRTYELTGYAPTGPAGRFTHGDFVETDPGDPGRLVHLFDSELPYEETPTGGRQRRLIGQTRTLYRKDDLTALLELGTLEPMALSGTTYTLAFTQGLLDQIFVRGGQSLLPNPAGVLNSGGADRGGYVASGQLKAAGLFPVTDPDERWWLPSGRVFLSPDGSDTAAQELAYAHQHFFLPRRYRDPFHSNAASTEGLVEYDAYDLLIVETRDAVGNRVTIGERLTNGDLDPAISGNDYRVLQPRRVMDPNRNRTQVAFDALGMVVGTAVMGKPGEAVGDMLDGFDPDLPEATTLAHLDDPPAQRNTILGRASTRLVYDLFAYRRTRGDPHPQPTVVHALTRETHDADLEPGAQTKVQLSFSYSDGFGREIQTKSKAEPEKIDGVPGPPRWVGSGWTIFNNKGKPVRRYEPFFSATHRFEFAVQAGVSAVLVYDPVQRVVATLHPNHTYEKVVFDSWQQSTWDANDTVLHDPRMDPDIKGFVQLFFAALTPPPGGWQTWHVQRQAATADAQEWAAAVKAEAHADTPTTACFDTLGRPFLTLADNGPDPAHPDRHLLFATRVERDIQGNERAVRDPIEQAGDARGRLVMRYAYDLLGNRIQQVSMEGDARWTLSDVAGNAIRAWDSRGHNLRHEYDPLRRPLRSFVTGADPTHPDRQLLTERLVYGEQHPDNELRNLRGRLYLHLDHVGAVSNEAHDFKGNLLRSSRRLADDYEHAIDWTPVDVALPGAATTRLDTSALEATIETLLEAETYANSTTYDALNRPVTVTTPHTATMQPSVVRHSYNEASLLEYVDANLNGANADGEPIWTPFVTNIEYDAKGRRRRVDYGNGASTSYHYDPLAFRLVHLLTRRSGVPSDCPDPPPAGWPGCHLQNLHYTYDPVGNITHIRDDAQQTIFFRNRRVEPSAAYTYDAVYRLVEAIGREHLGQAGNAPIPHSHNDSPRVGIDWEGNDGNAMGAYTERYVYDAVGNILELRHRGTDPVHAGWTRSYVYTEPSLLEDGTGGTLLKRSNRLSSTTVGPDAQIPERYVYDAHGNMIRLPHLGGVHPAPNVNWDHRDQLRRADLGGGGTAYYVYDAAGRRVRKIWKKNAGLIEERRYFGGFEIFRRRQGGDRLERETLHVMDDEQRVAVVETCTLDTAGDDPAPPQLIRYQLGNHLGSVGLELDGEARIISYEEYTPYGSTSYQAVRSATETSKRYRYTGKERDEETGLLYHGARYYAPWLARWTACDRLAKINRYAYARGSPVRLFDPDGKDESEGMTRFWGGLRMLGGAAQAVFGGAALLVPEPTMLTKVVGGIAVVNGADDFMTGWRQMISGRQERGAIETTVAITAEAAGMSRQNAEALGSGTSMALGFVSPTGPMTSGPRAVAAVTRTERVLATAGAMSREERAVVTAATETPRIVDHVRAAQLASNGVRAAHTMMMSSSGGGESSSSSSSSEGGSSSSSSSASTEPNSSQIPDEYFDEAMSRIDQGDLHASGAHLDDLTSYAQSSAARAERGISGQAAHISARSAMRTVAGYDPRAALTRILDVVAHRGFDDHWKRVFRDMARTTGESTIAVGEYFNIMRDAIGNNPHFTTQEANSMVELLRDELYVQHGLRDSDLLRLPYSK